MLRVSVIPARELTAAQRHSWSVLQSADAALDSPFFSSDFTQAVAAVRDDVEVAVLADGTETRGFFPFQRVAAGRGKPVGAPFSEFHGVIACPHLNWTPAELLKGCGLNSWSYDHLPVAQWRFGGRHRRTGDSPFLDLSEGFDAYCEKRRAAGSSVISQALRKTRKLAREVGPIEFELHCGDDALLEKLLTWKSQQHQRTGVLDVFQFPWVRHLLRSVRDAHGRDFRGMMSVLRAGRSPVAVHLGLCSRSVAHVWYPAYDPRFGKYSPGIALFLHLARELATRGIQRIDFGPGPQRYKRSLQSGCIPVAIGTVDRWPAARWARSGWTKAHQWLRGSRFHDPVRAPAQVLFRVRQWLEVR